MTFIAGLIVGIALATIVLGFVTLGSYERGFAAASSAPWRLELRSRRDHARHAARAAA